MSLPTHALDVYFASSVQIAKLNKQLDFSEPSSRRTQQAEKIWKCWEGFQRSREMAAMEIIRSLKSACKFYKTTYDSSFWSSAVLKLNEADPKTLIHFKSENEKRAKVLLLTNIKIKKSNLIIIDLRK